MKTGTKSLLIGAHWPPHVLTLRIYTARLPHHSCPGYRGPDRLDVTRSTGGRRADPFAPSPVLGVQA